jgi:3-deoxy-D-manno-octulosonic-acid transferase
MRRRMRLSERFALRLPSTPVGDGNIWIHALSVGEVISAIPLVKALRVKFPNRDIVFTVATSKGMSLARDQLKDRVKVLATMPVDCWWSLRRMVGYLKPSVFILVETDIWPGLIGYLRKKGVKSILVNGRISPRTYNVYRRFPYFVRMIFDAMDSCLMQSELDQERLLRTGICSEKVRVAGNMKFDRDWAPMGEKERRFWLGLLGLEPRDLVWVAGSTHPGEEETLLRVHKRLRASFEALRLLLAPRDITRSDEIRSLARGMGLTACLRTEVSGMVGSYDVLILNTVGELGRIYGLGMVSFVGGSLVPVGGHNLLEPASHGCPVLFGPYTHNFVLMSESLLEAGGGFRVKDEKGIYDGVKTLLSGLQTRLNMGKRAREFVMDNRGALDRIVSHIGGRLG